MKRAYFIGLLVLVLIFSGLSLSLSIFGSHRWIALALVPAVVGYLFILLNKHLLKDELAQHLDGLSSKATLAVITLYILLVFIDLRYPFKTVVSEDLIYILFLTVLTKIFFLLFFAPTPFRSSVLLGSIMAGAFGLVVLTLLVTRIPEVDTAPIFFFIFLICLPLVPLIVSFVSKPIAAGLYTLAGLWLAWNSLPALDHEFIFVSWYMNAEMLVAYVLLGVAWLTFKAWREEQQNQQTSSNLNSAAAV